jgi:TonB-dependent receptor-like protein
MNRCVAVLVALLALPALLLPAHAATATAPSLPDALRALSRPGLQFVFSSRLVPDTLRASTALQPGPPQPGGELQQATALLAPHGLALFRIGPGLYAVIKAPRTPAAPQPAPAGTPVAPTLGEVVVSASRYRVSDPAAALTQITAVDLALEIVPGSDPLRALGRLPGIVQDGFSARSHVRGGEQGEELLLLDGFPLRSPFHMAGYQSPFSVVDATLLRGIDVYTGGFPARYGNRLAAVFDLQTVTAAELPAHSVAIDFVNASARLAGQVPSLGLDVIADARIGTLDPLLRAVAPHAGRPRYGDGFFTARHAFETGAHIAGTLLWARDELAISDRTRQESAQMDGRLRYLWIQADTPLWEDSVGKLWVGQTGIDTRRTGTVATPGVVSGAVDDRRNSTLWDVRALTSWEIDARNFVEFGGAFTQEDGHYDYSANAAYPAAVAALFDRSASFARALQLDPRRRRSSLFVSHRWRILPQLTSELGLRGEAVITQGLETRWDLDPRTGLRWDIRDDTHVHMNWGRFRQADEIQELKIEDGLTRFPSPQVSEHLILGIDHARSEATSMRLEVFAKRQSRPRARFENLFNRRSILPELGPDRVEVLPDSSEVHGIELSGRTRRGAWLLSGSAGWSEALDENAAGHTRRSWDIGWDYSLAASWQRGPWTASSSLERHRGFPTTQLVTDAAGEQQVGPRNGAILPAVVELDLRVEYDQAYAAGALQYSAQLTNVLNSSNPCCSELLSEGNGLYLRRLRGLPLLPSLGIRWSW